MTTSRVGRVTVVNLWPETDALNIDIGNGVTLTVSKEPNSVTVYIQDDDTSDSLTYVVGDNEVMDANGEYKILSDEYPYFEGARVVALCTVTDSGYAPGDPEAPENDTVAAEEGDTGTIELIDAGNHCLPTVRFHKTGHATIVTEDEIALAED